MDENGSDATSDGYPPDTRDCTCMSCQQGCMKKPGWFVPGEAEKVAEYLDVPLEQLFREKLMVDWYVGNGPDRTDTFVLSPAITGNPAGREFPAFPYGRCVFFKEGRCTIHAVKPLECRKASHGLPPDGFRTVHAQIGDDWRGEPQEQIRQLLGREPESVPYEGCTDWF